MDFDLSAEQNMLREAVRAFVKNECPRDLVRAADADHLFPMDIYAKLADLGLLGIAAPTEGGRPGGGALDQVIIAEELAKGSVALAVAFVNTACLGGAVIAAQSAPNRDRLLADIAAGKLLISFAWTEPGAGSDILALRTSAEPTPSGGYRINGGKTFVTLAKEAGYLLTIVRTRPATGTSRSDGLTCLAVPTALAGLSINPIGKVGQRSTPFYDVSFVDVDVPADHTIGEPHTAWRQLLPLLGAERSLFAAICLGIARQAFTEAVEYSLNREAFGRTIAHLQAVQHHIADMKTSIDASELLVYRSAWLADAGRLQGAETTQALMVAANAASLVTDLGMQILGAAGYSEEFDMERYWRDARAFRLSPVSTEVAKNLVARDVGLPRSY